MVRITAIVPSAGRSQRMRASGEKPYLLLQDKPVLAHTLLSLARSPLIQEIVLLVRRPRLGAARKLVRAFKVRKIIGIYPGGRSRFESVWKGLRRVSPETDYVLVHDGVRPLVNQALIRRVVRGARRTGAAIPVLPIASTVKRGKGRFVQETLRRRDLWEVQTPQVFRRALLLEGYRKAKREGTVTTDCAALVERLGREVLLVPGDSRNLKVTTCEELAFAVFLMKRRSFRPCVWG